jgi:hypothetical protein
MKAMLSYRLDSMILSTNFFLARKHYSISFLHKT